VAQVLHTHNQDQAHPNLTEWKAEQDAFPWGFAMCMY